MKIVSRFLNSAVILLFILLFIGAVIATCNSKPKVKVLNYERMMAKLEPNSKKVTLNKLYAECLEYGIHHSEIVCNQALLESGRFTSPVFKRTNNLFGFRTNNGYLSFKDWKASVKYYKKWQIKRYKGGDYYTFLRKAKYAEDPFYNAKLKSMGFPTQWQLLTPVR